MIDIVHVVGMVLIGGGIAFDLFGCLGLVRLPDVYNRLQAATKCVTLGTCGILLGTCLIVGLSGGGWRALLCILFVVLTAPVSAHAIARGAHRAGIALWEGSVADAYREDRDTLDAKQQVASDTAPAASQSENRT
ncbi:MAG TPA: monovalent cation/H(+) antiporter subunit G [Candidatus Hydrogenedentes bacterium]|nr:monovalent cation/H(+) antiporter subunit G [Candidatus Hydrogenedentota bacterium]HQE81425.1 monovalent cation/H(+) antiporter subunit G [Candidatus Hydrogenedentota bacterium]HQM50925.1 monovalent cation/H(+) antiporter subunit G [Candidatus Hydrogenedentota bacterium]